MNYKTVLVERMLIDGKSYCSNWKNERGIEKGNREEQGLSLFILSFESLWDETSRNTDRGEANDLNYGADSFF